MILTKDKVIHCRLAYCKSDTIQTSRCNCTKPCTQTLYEPTLSQAALSILSVDSILSTDMDPLQRQYYNAIESYQRVTDVVFAGDLQRVLDIQRHYLNLRRFAKTYLGDFDKSSFAKVANNSLVRCLTRSFNSKYTKLYRY